jgi:hypothetical protein
MGLAVESRAHAIKKNVMDTQYGLCGWAQVTIPSVVADADAEAYAMMRVRITIRAFAYHGYAEINFADGAANYIDPLLLVAWPS